MIKGSRPEKMTEIGKLFRCNRTMSIAPDQQPEIPYGKCWEACRGHVSSSEGDLAAMIKKDPVEAKKIQAKMAALRDANENMSIAPLIKAGEFSTISESLSEADVSIREGRWADFIENAVDKLPAGCQ